MINQITRYHLDQAAEAAYREFTAAGTYRERDRQLFLLGFWQGVNYRVGKGEGSMNLRLISKALHTLSQLSDEDVAVVIGLRSASEDERAVLMLALEPNKPPQKKSSKKAAGKTATLCIACGHGQSSARHSDSRLDNYHPFQSGAGKSKRVNGMAEQLSKSLESQRRVTAGACTFVLENGAVCNTGDNNPIHDESFGYAGYHPFQPPVPTVAKRLRQPYSEQEAYGASSETETETDVAGVAVSGGD